MLKHRRDFTCHKRPLPQDRVAIGDAEHARQHKQDVLAVPAPVQVVPARAPGLSRDDNLVRPGEAAHDKHAQTEVAGLQANVVCVRTGQAPLDIVGHLGMRAGHQSTTSRPSCACQQAARAHELDFFPEIANRGQSGDSLYQWYRIFVPRTKSKYSTNLTPYPI